MNEKIIYILSKPQTGIIATTTGWVISKMPAHEVIFTIIQNFSLCLGVCIGLVTLFLQLDKAIKRINEIIKNIKDKKNASKK